MKIVHLLEHVRELGNGGVNAAVDLACKQAKLGHTVAIISKGGAYERLLAEYGVQHFEAHQSTKTAQYISYAKQCSIAIKAFQPDIVHAHTMVSVTVAWLFKFISRYHLVSTVHNEFQKSAVLMGLADRVIAVSHAGAKSISRRGIPKNKIRTVLNAIIDSPRCKPLSYYSPHPLQHPAIVTLAGLHLRKGHIELIQAFAQIADQFPNAHLYLVGDGPDRQQIEAAAHQTSVAQRIHFEGFHPEPQGYLLGCDVFVLASHHEPFGLAIAEARAAGCAIIASNVDGIPEVLEYGNAGVLVPVGDINALASAIANFLAHEKERNLWQQKARENLDWLNVDRAVQETLAVYQELLM